MGKLVVRLTAWLEAKSKVEPIPGWLPQWLLMVLCWVCLYFGYPEPALTCIVGSLVVSVIRMIEAERRKRDAQAR